jgi:hypothetical protein
MRNFTATLGIALLLVLAAIGAGGMIGYLQIKYPSATCMVFELFGLCK